MECKICNSQDAKVIFVSQNVHGRHILSNDKFNICQCSECGIIFPETLVNSEYYSKYYPKDYYENDIKNGFVNWLLILFSKIVIRFKEFDIVKDSGFKGCGNIKILDIGCGSGEFLSNINPTRFEKYGVEINPEGVRKCKEKKLNVFAAQLKDAKFEPGSFDVITMWHVLEHLDNPRDLLREAHRVLKSRGILIIATPNTDSLGFKYGIKNWFHLDSPRHLILYNRKATRLLLECMGFKVKHFRNYFYDYPLDLFWSVRQSKLKYLVYPFYFFYKIFSREALTVIAVKD